MPTLQPRVPCLSLLPTFGGWSGSTNLSLWSCSPSVSRLGRYINNFSKLLNAAVYVMSGDGFALVSQRKCEMYWPENVNETLQPGANISVTLISQMPFADYEIKKFTVQDVSISYECSS